jgi:hypothetical protein
MRATRIGLVGAAFVIAAACGGSAPATDTQTTTPPPPQTAPNAAQASQQMADALQKMGQAQTATAVDFEKLIAFLPEPAGWTRSKPEGKQMSMGVSMSQAQAEYTKGESSIRLEITDSSFNQMFLAPMSMMLMSSYSERSSSGYKKAASLGGSPGFEEWENEPKDGTVTVVVGNRFVVAAKGRHVENIDAIRALVTAVDLGKLAALK